MLQFDEVGARVLPDRVPVGHRSIDAGTGGEIMQEAVMRDRRRLSEFGVLVPVVTIDERKGEAVDVEMISRGFAVSEDANGLVVGAGEAIRAAVGSCSAEELGDLGVMEERVRNEVRRYVARKTSRQSQPLIVPIILEG